MTNPSLLRTSRLILPAAFLGYAAFANLSVLTGGGADDLDRVGGSLVRGEVTANLGELYARGMPHREGAVAWLGATRYLLAGEGRDGVAVGEDGWLFTEEELVTATDAQIARAVDEAVSAAERLDRLGTRLVILPLPAKIDIYGARFSDPSAGRAMEDQYRRFLSALAAARIQAVDVRPALKRAARDGQAFLIRDTHWTPEGAEAAAAAVARSNRVLPGADTFAARPGPTEEVEGDLVSFVTSLRLAPYLGLEPEAVTPFVADPTGAEGGGIFAADAPAPSMLLVGTSYSADSRWSFAPALSLALSRDVLNLAQEGQGPVRPLRSLLNDRTLVASSPDYVLWEFPVRYLGDPSIWPDDLHANAGATPQGSL